MASGVKLLKEANNSDKLLVEGCDPYIYQSSVMSHIKDPTLTPELRNKVFGNELIRDKIFDYVFTDSNGKLSMKDVLKCRQVDKSWLDYASYRLQETGSPQFTIDFKYRFFSINHQKNFLDTWANVNFPDAGSRIPLFNLYFDVISANISNKDRFQDLKNILSQCANGLHSFSIGVTETEYNVGPVNNSPPERFVPYFGEIHLPKLQKLDLHLQDRVIGTNVNTLLRCILSGCQQLTSLSVRASGNVLLEGLFSVDGRFLDETEKVPDTLVKIEIHVSTTTNLMGNMLLINFLPNLTELLLTIPVVGDEIDVIFQILDRFCLQLKQFTVFGCLTSKPLAYINFPVMSKLEYMSVSSAQFKNVPRAEHFQPFPSLETLILTYQTTRTLESWIQNLYFSSVKRLTVDGSCSSNINEDIFTLEMSHQVHLSFPHLQDLDITFGTFQDYSVRNIFQRMVNLRKLSMQIVYTDEITGAATWDAILVGVTPEYAATLASSRDQWDSINLHDHRVPSHSISNLTHLESLTLRAINLDDDFELIISDVSFRFAFLCMPKLHELTFSGKFGASDDMMQQWRARGSEINCACLKCIQASYDDDDDDDDYDEDHDDGDENSDSDVG